MLRCSRFKQWKTVKYISKIIWNMFFPCIRIHFLTQLVTTIAFLIDHLLTIFAFLIDSLITTIPIHSDHLISTIAFLIDHLITTIIFIMCQNKNHCLSYWSLYIQPLPFSSWNIIYSCIFNLSHFQLLHELSKTYFLLVLFFMYIEQSLRWIVVNVILFNEVQT